MDAFFHIIPCSKAKTTYYMATEAIASVAINYIMGYD